MEDFKDLLISFVKVLIPCAVIALIIFILLKVQPEEEIPPEILVHGFSEEGSDLVLENDALKLVMDTATTQFSVETKSNGNIWYSNPQDIEDDASALTADKENLNSTLMLTYGSINGVWTIYNNYGLSIENGLYEIESDDDHIKVMYTIGKVKKEFIVPIAVPESRMNELLDLMDKKQKKQVKEYYRKYDINKLRKTDDKDALLKQYPDLVDEPIYVLLDSAADYLKKKIEGIFESIGYTREDYEADLARYETVSEQDMPLFNIAVEYRLEGDRLVVSVPLEEIEYKDKYPLVSLEVLPYMGAGSKSAEGYMIVPESGGGVINFNNGRQQQNAYTSNIYGWDYCKSRDAVVTETRNAAPVFAIANNGSSFVCVADEGAGYAAVSADVSGRFHGYNHASFSYTMLHYEKYDVSGKSNSEFYVYEDKIPSGQIVQKYCFSDSTDYVDLAGTYRTYLLEKYPGLAGASDASLPVVVDVLQAVDKVQQKFGVPVSAALPLTTYDETVELADELALIGIDNYAMKISGWMNGGVKHDVLGSVSLIHDLGGKKKFGKMLDSLAQRNIPVYLDAQVEFAYDSNFFDGFMAFRDSAKFTSREETELYTYSIVWYGQEDYNDPFYLLKPQKMFDYYHTISNYVKSRNVGLSMRNMGYILNSDFNPKNLYTRSMMIDEERKLLAGTASEGTGIIINYGNDYALEYADIVTSMDITSSNTAIIDYDIPFYQIALHGLLNYTGNPINLSEDYERELLKSAEYGAGLSFTFMLEEPETLQDTLYTEYYGADFSTWKDKVASMYAKYKQSFDGLYDKAITGHKLVGDNCRVTEYEDGTKVYVNFGFIDETVDGIRVPARDYTVERGEAR